MSRLSKVEKLQKKNTDQNGLQLILCAFGLVHQHLLRNIFPVLHTVQLVVGVAVEHRPAKELRQGLNQNKGSGRDVNTRKYMIKVHLVNLIDREIDG